MALGKEMIKALHIQNFQAHRDLKLDLSPGVNFIVGSSDSGKTAIIRALKWLATNRPLGDAFVSWDSKGETMVKVVMDDETTIAHEPGQYGMIAGSKMQNWSAIGTTVPETVTQALNISELSWQNQLDPPFLLSASPGEVARTLNEVADLDKIDSTLANINRTARDNRAQLTETARAKQQLEIDLSAFRELDNQLAKVAQLKEMERKAGLLEDMVAEGDQLVASITDQNEELIRYEDVEERLEHVKHLNGLVIQAALLELEAEKGWACLDEVKKLTDQLKAIKDPADAEAELDLLLDMVGQAKKLDKDIDDLRNQLVRIQDTQVGLTEQTGFLKRLETQWHEQFPEICPLCGRSGK